MSINNILSKLQSPRNNAAFIIVNILLGTGPLITPEPFFRAGFVFSTIWTCIVCFLSYITIHYVEESIILINKHMNEKSILSLEEQKEEDEVLESEGGVTKFIRTFDHCELF